MLPIILAGLILFGPAWLKGEEQEPFTFQMLRYDFSMTGWVDFAMTTIVVNSGQAKELNPVMRFYVEKPAISLALFTAGDFAVQWGLSKLWQKNKAWAWAMLAVLTAVRAYVLLNNLRQMN